MPEQLESEPQATTPGATGGFNWGRGLLGAAAGGAAGYFLVGWLARQGFYGIALPGVLLGLGAGWLGRGGSRPFGILCGVTGLVLGMLSEWSYFPWVKDKSFSFFLTHLPDQPPVTLLMILLGGAAAFWFAWRRTGPVAPPKAGP
jgi:hypothetical protein